MKTFFKNIDSEIPFLYNHLTYSLQAAMESLMSGAICGISYHIFAGQPLTVIGSTGPVLVFETIVYHFCQ